MDRRRPSRLGIPLVAAGAAALLLIPVSAPADTPSPSPLPSTAAPASLAPSSPPPSSPPPSSPPASSPPPASPSAPAHALTLRVDPVNSPDPTRFFEDLGSFGFTGAAAEVADGTPVRIYRRAPGGPWAAAAETTARQGAFAATLPVTAAGPVEFIASTGDDPAAGGTDDVRSPVVGVEVADATVALDAPPVFVNSLKTPRLTGTVWPARAGVQVRLEVWRSGAFHDVGTAPTDAAGKFTIGFSYGKGRLATYRVRAAYLAVNRNRWETSAERAVRRVAILDPAVRQTTAAEVASTYHRGCPVGRSRLRTIALNYYGRDKRMHRGVVIVRAGLTDEVIRGFGSALAHRYPIARMSNPNVWDGNDPRQMKANNTSGFNCRTVVGNPYRMSPHSWGIAIDVNPVQNPYRDVRGRWWPSNGTSYIDRTPHRWGMLTRNSYLTRSLRSDGYFWGGFWSPGRDYQHFEYRG